jgi:signal transduction histidine kinase
VNENYEKDMIKALLDWAVLTVSFYNTISLLWLGVMVLLAGNRRSPGTWLTGGGLLTGALFFTSHTAILGRGLASTSLGMDFWWAVSWIPAALAPMAWYGAMLWHSGYRFSRPHPHHTWVIFVTVLAIGIGLLLVFANPLPKYQYVAGQVILETPSIAGVPLLILAYLGYSLMCYLLPLDALRRVSGDSPQEIRSRQRARPWLTAASIALLLAGILLTWTAFWAVTTRPVPSLSDPRVEQFVKTLDLSVATLVAVAITLLGRAVVRFEVFTGRPLPRSRFFRQWRSTVILATGFGAAASFTLMIELRPLYSLMLATVLMTLFYALYAWRAFAEREAFMARLRPFVASQDLYGQMTGQQKPLPAPGQQQPLTAPGQPSGPGQQPETGEKAEALFDSLCREVLETRLAVLIPAGALATLAGPPLVYPPDAELPTLEPDRWAGRFPPGVTCLPANQVGGPQAFDWAIPLWSSRGLDGALFLGEKISGGPFSEEEMEIAQAAGERLLDLLAGAEMARLSMDLLRQSLSQSRVLEGQGRRVLHDELLPQLHTALLYLSGGPADHPAVRQASEVLSAAHRRISGLIREMPLPSPHRLAQSGLVSALESMVETDFAAEFDKITWEIQPGAAQATRELPLFVNEVVFFAARELVRNAADHARGEETGRPVCLTLRIELAPSLRLSVTDNGVGYHPELTRQAGGSGSGLRIHSAMLAAVDGRLEVLPAPGGGTEGLITLSSTLTGGAGQSGG